MQATPPVAWTLAQDLAEMSNDLSTVLDGRGAWPDLLRPTVRLGQWLDLAVLDPRPDEEDLTMALRVLTPAQESLFATVSWAQLYRAVVMIATCYGPPLHEEDAEAVRTEETRRTERTAPQ